METRQVLNYQCPTNLYSNYSYVNPGVTRPTTTVEPMRCEDINQYCPRWATAGYCTGKYEVYMAANCQLSCDLCNDGKDNSTCIVCKLIYVVHAPVYYGSTYRCMYILCVCMLLSLYVCIYVCLFGCMFLCIYACFICMCLYYLDMNVCIADIG